MNQKKYFPNRKLYGHNNSGLYENDYDYHGKKHDPYTYYSDYELYGVDGCEREG